MRLKRIRNNNNNNNINALTYTEEVPWAFGDIMDSSPMTTGGPNRFPDILLVVFLVYSLLLCIVLLVVSRMS
jgi:hypothetical protein